MKTIENPRVTKKKEAIHERSEKLDPNNKISNSEIHLRKKGKKLVIDDGFEHRTSKETTDPILPS